MPVPALAQADKAIDAASQAERLGLIGVLALVGIALGYVLWRMYLKMIAGYEATEKRLIAERDRAIKRNDDLHAYINDVVLPLVTEANRAASRTMRRVLDEQ